MAAAKAGLTTISRRSGERTLQNRTVLVMKGEIKPFGGWQPDRSGASYRQCDAVEDTSAANDNRIYLARAF